MSSDQKRLAPKPKPISESRKIRKPLMERKRRERINSSLNQLASFLKEAKMVKNEPGKQTKLEKADILELTVKHLQQISSNKENQPKGTSLPDSATERFRQGFQKCIGIVEQTLKCSTSDKLVERLLRHLNNRLRTLCPPQRQTTNSDPEHIPPAAAMDTTVSPENKRRDLDTRSDQDEASSTSALTLVPTELPGGEVAFLLKGDPKLLFPEFGTATSDFKPNVAVNADQCPLPTLHNGMPSAEFQAEISLPPRSTMASLQCLPLTKGTSNFLPHLGGISPSREDKGSIKLPSANCLPTSIKSELTSPGKGTCPPTPPPSPHFTSSGQRASPSRGATRHALSADSMRLSAPLVPLERENGLTPFRHPAILDLDGDDDSVEPFDLSVSKVWRPW